MLSQLKPHYTGVVLVRERESILDQCHFVTLLQAYGAEDDKPLRIPGEVSKCKIVS